MNITNLAEYSAARSMIRWPLQARPARNWQTIFERDRGIATQAARDLGYALRIEDAGDGFIHAFFTHRALRPR